MIETIGRVEDRSLPRNPVMTSRVLASAALIAVLLTQSFVCSAAALSVADQIPQWERYVQAHPTEVRAKFKLGSLYFFNKQFNEAVEEWRSVLFKPSIRLNTKSQVKLARVISIAYFKLGNLSSSWKYIRWAYKQNPKDPAVRKVAVSVKRAILASQRKSPVATSRSATDAASGDTGGGVQGDAPTPPVASPVGPPVPTEAEAKAAYDHGKELFDEGRLLLGQDDVQYEKSLLSAIEQFKIAIRAKYKEPRTQYYIGSAYLFLASDEYMSKAQEHLELSLNLEKDDETHFHLGKVYGLTAQKDKEIAMYEEAVLLNPDNAEYHFNLALAYDKSPREDALRKTFEHAKAAIRLKSEYKRRFQEVLKNSEVARKIAGIVRDIIEKTENDELTDEETEKYAKKIQDMLGEKIDPAEFNNGGGRDKIKDLVNNNDKAKEFLESQGTSVDEMLDDPKNKKMRDKLQRRLKQ